MARISRKTINQSIEIENKHRFKTAIYVRLSVEDNNRNDKDTLQNQEDLVRAYLQGKEDFNIIATYRDNGETGVNFKRNGFETLMDDIKKGKINCVVCKDLSRFGRNYLEAGEYLEKIFPFLGVRFIAVNESYDSFNTTKSDELLMHLLNLTNDIYAKDISAKISPVLRGKQERGEFIGAWASYGYLKDPSNKHKLIVDEETAPIVIKMFELKASGMSNNKIAKHLTDNGILSPSAYRYSKGIITNKRFENAQWNCTNIKNILKNMVYLGHMVQGRKRESLFEGKKQYFLPKEEWCIVENTHEPIVSKELFDKANSVLEQRAEEYHKKMGVYDDIPREENIYAGLLYCGKCGKPLVKYRNIRKGKTKTTQFYSYICPIHANNVDACTFTSIHDKRLDEAVFHAVRVEIAKAIKTEQILNRKVYQTRFNSKVDKISGKLEKVKKQLSDVIRKKSTLYDDYVEGLMSETDYVFMRDRYKQSEEDLRVALLQLEEDFIVAKKATPKENDWLQNTLKFAEETVLSKELLQVLIHKITMYSKTEMQIVFNFEDTYKVIPSPSLGKEVTYE